jgi:hypothetical protein
VDAGESSGVLVGGIEKAVTRSFRDEVPGGDSGSATTDMIMFLDAAYASFVCCS